MQEEQQQANIALIVEQVSWVVPLIDIIVEENWGFDLNSRLNTREANNDYAEMHYDVVW